MLAGPVLFGGPAFALGELVSRNAVRLAPGEVLYVKAGHYPGSMLFELRRGDFAVGELMHEIDLAESPFAVLGRGWHQAAAIRRLQHTLNLP